MAETAFPKFQIDLSYESGINRYGKATNGKTVMCHVRGDNPQEVARLAHELDQAYQKETANTK